MLSSTYRLLRETTAVVTQNGRPSLFTIPAGSVITVQEAPSQETGLVPIQWERRTVKMFAADLERRAELIAIVASDPRM